MDRAGTRKRRTSMEDVAAAAGVSKTADSEVVRNAYGVSPAMRDRVESAIEALGYRPASPRDHCGARASPWESRSRKWPPTSSPRCCRDWSTS